MPESNHQRRYLMQAIQWNRRVHATFEWVRDGTQL